MAIHGIVWVGLAAAPVRERVPVPRPDRSLRVFEIAAAAPARPPPAPPVDPPEPPATAVPKAVPKVPHATAAAPRTPASAPEIAAPARTAQAIAASPDVLDFTDFDIASGDGDRFVGGVSSSAGTNTVAARGEDVAVGGSVGRPNATGRSLSRSVRLPAGNWICPWPDDARALHDREREVRLRATVREDGTVAAVELLSDPGHGFGEAALRCARAARFAPALDAEGRPVEARSPPIRVRFVR